MSAKTTGAADLRRCLMLEMSLPLQRIRRLATEHYLPFLRMSAFRSLGLILLTFALAAAELPMTPPGTWECHGIVQLRGQAQAERFWLRLLPTDSKFGGNRMLQIVYTPPSAAVLGGTVLADAPFLLLDAQARIVAWNDRVGLSQITPGASGEATYVVTRDRTHDDHAAVNTETRKLSGERGWDRSVALLLVAISWREASQAHLPCLDFFGNEPTALVSWTGRKLTIADQSFTVETDAAGRLKQIISPTGTPVLTVTQWLQEGR